MPPRKIILRETFPGRSIDPVAGGAILREAPRRWGVHLIRLYRAIMLWAADPPNRRSGTMFVDGGMAALASRIAADLRISDDAVGEPLFLIASELAREEPDVPRLARACLAVADWALARSSPATAIAFSDAAAAVHPNARYALLSGRLHREHGQPREARQWLHRASILASHAGDWEARTRPLLSSGNLHLVAGRYDHAAGYFAQAHALATRHRLREQIGEASHDLFTIAITKKDRKAADAALIEAVRHYPAGHHALPALGHDVAAYWIDLNDFESARAVLLGLLDRHWSDAPALRLLACGTALRALGGCDRAEEFATLHGEFQRLADMVEGTPRLAQALLSAAQGAVSLREWGTAESLLSAAAEEARKTGQQDTLLSVGRMVPRVSDRRDEPKVVANPRISRARAADKSMEWLKKLL